MHSGKVEEHRTLIKHLLCSSGGKQWISRASALPLYEPGGHAPQRPVTLIGPRSRGPRSCSAPPAPPPSRPVSPEPGDAGAPGVWGGNTRRARKTHILRIGLRRGRAQFPYSDHKNISSFERLLCTPRGAKHFPNRGLQIYQIPSLCGSAGKWE